MNCKIIGLLCKIIGHFHIPVLMKFYKFDLQDHLIMQTGRILVVDDNKNALSALKMLLQLEFETVVTLANPNLIIGRTKKRGF